jgi:hypothetical protein
MHIYPQILSPEQEKLTSFISQYADKFCLVWGTAIALQLWHRQSVDFDLFLPNSEYLPQKYLTQKWKQMHFSCIKWHEDDHQQHYIVNWVKLTFFAYTYDIPQALIVDRWIVPMPNLLHLSAMKIHALSNRSKWKDYVDLAFLIRELDIYRIATYTKEFFGGDISLKVLCSQLSYFEDIDYDDVVVYMPGRERDESSIKQFLIEQSQLLFASL